jgi:hypothetical protein
VGRVYTCEAHEDSREGDQPGRDEREARSTRARLVAHGPDPRGADKEFSGQEAAGALRC